MYDLLRCVDRGLDSFGSNMKQAVYWTLMSKETISSDEILTHPDAFIRSLKEIFGNGYLLAQRAIVKEIKKTFEIDMPQGTYDLLEALDLASKEITDLPRLATLQETIRSR
jgi:hypothetical protein